MSEQGPGPPSQELEHIAGLLRDFGEDGWTEDRAPEAFREITARSRQLESLFEGDVFFAAGMSEGDVDLWIILEVIGRSVHLHLFEQILTNASMYRQHDDPEGGHVEFGGPKGQTHRSLFTGSPAIEIDVGVGKAYAKLLDVRQEAFARVPSRRKAARLEASRASALFYKDFSGVHPFYDGNGRVGRYVVSVYLALHGLSLRWQDMDRREAKLLKRINECLKRQHHPDPSAEIEYEEYLVQFWNEFVDDLPQGSAFEEISGA